MLKFPWRPSRAYSSSKSSETVYSVPRGPSLVIITIYLRCLFYARVKRRRLFTIWLIWPRPCTRFPINMILRLFLHFSIRVVCFTNTFLSVISRTSSRDSKHSSAVNQKVMFFIELVNITFKQGTLGLIEMYLQFLDNVTCISWDKTRLCIEIFLRHSRDHTEYAIPPFEKQFWIGVGSEVKIK